MKIQKIVIFSLLAGMGTLKPMVSYKPNWSKSGNFAHIPPNFSHLGVKNMSFGNFNRFLHIDQLKGLYSSLHDTKKHLSPVHGAAFIESGYLKNLYTYGNKNDAMVQLLGATGKGLFHAHGEEFKPTNNKSLPGSSLTPAVLGTIVGALENGSLQKPETIDAITKQWRATHKEKNKGEALSEKKVHNLISLIAQSADECDPTNQTSRYLPYTVHSILNGFLYKKAEKKDEVKQYFDNISTYTPVIKDGHEQYVDAMYTDTDLDTYVDDLQKIPCEWSNNEQQKFVTSQDHYEQTVHTIVKEKQMAMPSRVELSLYSYRNQASTPNCMEASMHNIFNWLCYRPGSTTFDLTMLPDNINPHEKLKQFYTDHASLSEVSDKNVGQAWMNMVSGHDFLKYKKGNYDLNGRISNLINLTNYLLNTNATTLDELGKQLSDNKRTVEFVADDVKDDNEAQITITFTYCNSQASRKELLLRFMPGHTDIKLPSDASKSSVYSRNLGKTLSEDLANHYKNTHIASLEVQNSMYLQGLVPNPYNTGYFNNESHKLAMHDLCSSRLDNDEAKIDTIISMLKNNRTLQCDETIIALCKSISAEDAYLKLGRSLVDKNCLETLDIHPNIKHILMNNADVAWGISKAVISDLDDIRIVSDSGIDENYYEWNKHFSKVEAWFFNALNSEKNVYRFLQLLESKHLGISTKRSCIRSLIGIGDTNIVPALLKEVCATLDIPMTCS